MSKDPLKYFRIEARELHERLAKGVLDLERGGPLGDAVAHLLRVAHTLKGAARVVKQQELADHAHAVEDALAPLRDGHAPAERAQIEALLGLVDEIGRRIATLAAPPASAEAAAASPPVPGPEEPILRAEVGDLDLVLDGLAEVHALVSSARRSTTAVERARRLADLLVEELGSPRAGGPPSLRTRSVASEIAGLLGAIDRDVARGLDQVDGEIRQVRDVAERLRLLPARVLLDAAERACRDAAQATGKAVAFEARGGGVRLDAQVLGPLQVAFVQLVRNAVAHGIEPEAERQALGKPARGTVSVEVTRRGARIVFACRDDGAGIDVAAVRRVAERQGLPPERGAELSPSELLRLLLRSGLSTSATVTAVAGRGVGLDVVRDAARRAGGEVRVETERGRGTHVEIDVPLTLSSIETLLVEAQGVAAAIPLDAVSKTIRVPPEQVVATAEGDGILHDGALVPFVPLARPLLGAMTPARGGRPWSAVVLGAGSSSTAVGVDRLAGTATVVVRPLPELSPADPVVFGVALDVQGDPRLLLDPEVLALAARRTPAAPPLQVASRLPILVIDDSLTTRMLEQSILESAGYEVDVASSGEQALEMARRRRYGLFLVDVEMPGMDGFTFIRATRADAALGDVPSILVTSRAGPEDRRRGEEVGARAYVVKSEFDQSVLLGWLADLVGAR